MRTNTTVRTAIAITVTFALTERPRLCSFRGVNLTPTNQEV